MSVTMVILHNSTNASPKTKSATTEVIAPKNANSNCCYTKTNEMDISPQQPAESTFLPSQKLTVIKPQRTPYENRAFIQIVYSFLCSKSIIPHIEFLVNRKLKKYFLGFCLLDVRSCCVSFAC